MYNNNAYYEAPYDDEYPDDWDYKVEQYAFDMLRNEYNYHNPENWGEGLSECGFDEELYPTPSHAPVEVIEKVSVYWYDIAFAKATEYYEEYPDND
jgi:hypothetical protein